MNAVEIEQAVSELAEQPFDRAEFSFQFLAAFGKQDTSLKRLHTGVSNKSVVGGVLQTNNIPIATCAQVLPQHPRRHDSTQQLTVSLRKPLVDFIPGSGAAVGKFGQGPNTRCMLWEGPQSRDRPDRQHRFSV